jgi:predicted O-methyltransferase YrrM
MIDSRIDTVLQRIEEQEKFEQENPHEIPNSEKVLAIGRNTGIFYNILLSTMKAKNILEIGMSTGYSTMWFANAISKTNGNIITIDFDQKKIERAKKNFDEAKVNDFIEIRNGDAIEVLSEISQEKNFQNFFDFVFIDADKERYIQYFDSVLPQVDNFIEIRHGDALEVLFEIRQEKNFQNFFDFVFIDADKERYIQYFDSVLPLVKTGGIILIIFCILNGSKNLQFHM